MALEKVTIYYSKQPIYRAEFGDDMVAVNALELNAPEFVIKDAQADINDRAGIEDVLRERGIDASINPCIMVVHESRKAWRSDGRVINI